MKLTWKFLLIVSAALMLTGCEDKLSYSYLISHPIKLKAAVEKCQSMTTKTEEQSTQCEVVMFAATNFMSVLSDEQNNPQQFGQRIMQSEINNVAAEQQVISAQKALDDLRQQKAPDANIKVAQEKLITAKKNYQEKRDELKLLMGVAGLNSPE